MHHHEEILKSATDFILNTVHDKKLIIAGPGAGKTYIFTKLLESLRSQKDDQIVLTFINTLKADLENNLSHLSKVYTLHGFCNYLLHNHTELRNGLSENFSYYPPLVKLICSDWKIINKTPIPKFVQLMRSATTDDALKFYFKQSNYYDSVSYDESVYRVLQELDKLNPPLKFKLILIDEFQDFNQLESSLIKKISDNSPIVIAGDDDQALYSILRDASHKFIRDLHGDAAYLNCELPYCMRCTEVVINAVNQIILQTQTAKLLTGRIPKPYLHYPPSKGVDSALYPQIDVIECTTQSPNANYFGKYIVESLNKIPTDEIDESYEKGFPTALIIGQKQYLDQIEPVLREQGFNIQAKKSDESMVIKRADGLMYLKNNPNSNLGWRIILEIDNPDWKESIIKKSFEDDNDIFNLIPEPYKENILAEAESFSVDLELEEIKTIDTTRPSVKLTSFEGSKGLSAQHVFIVGLHENELPKKVDNILDIEICKFLVAMTRTRKKCYIMTAFRFCGAQKKPSIFLSWISPEMKKVIKVDKDYWAIPTPHLKAEAVL